MVSSFLTGVKRGKGGLLEFAEGIFTVSAPIEVPSHTCLVGAGMEKTIIRLADYANKFEGKGKGIFYSAKGERVSILALTIDGNKAMQNDKVLEPLSGVYFELVNYAWFRHVRSLSHMKYGCKKNHLILAIWISRENFTHIIDCFCNLLLMLS